MNLKCIFDVEKDEVTIKKYQEIYRNLKEKYGVGEYKNFHKYDSQENALFEDYKCVSGYAHCIHTGKIKEGIKLNELELSMICDDGFSHFGGYSNIGSDGRFTVKIYTD
ncbi:hypothetical protein FDA33_17420 [Clostridium botulinum]|nr:hypothetical protein [Clostridium botulinum]NFI17191.1 hypothetical protein [Clostridium botulinum]NFL93528.1 hypothetical protein [Clostridium botulinum]NFN51604.1 hypothetical protein [Clostridium botulinum]NFO27565.1 hypothetical protein [Clostridium botulinum]